jgi:hypothetical protein
MKYFVYAIIAIVSATVIAGFFIVGSPQEERLRRFDQQRVEHLQFLQSEILHYWINKERLPAQLSDLQDNIRGLAIPTDPETGAEYIYEKGNDLTFTLCATFARESLDYDEISGKPRPAEPFGYGIQQNWQHGAGYTCFERTIDEDFYKPIKQR